MQDVLSNSIFILATPIGAEVRWIATEILCFYSLFLSLIIVGIIAYFKKEIMIIAEMK